MAAGDAFLIEDTGAETNRTHTTENDRGLAGTPILEQGDFSGEWTSPDLNIPNTASILCGYSDFLRQSGTTRSGSVCQFRVNTTNQGMPGVTSWGYNRFSGGADESSRHGVMLANLTALDDLQVREGTVLNSSDRIGDYDRTSGDPRGFWAIELPDNDYIFTSSSPAEVGAGRYGNTPRPIDLGTPSALSEGSYKAIDSLSTDASNGTTITRSVGTFTIAANSKVLCVAKFQFNTGASNDRNCALVRCSKNGSPYCYIALYLRNASSDIMSGDIVMPMVTGGSSETVTFEFVEQVEETVPEVDMGDCDIRFFDLTAADMCILENATNDVTTIDATVRQFSFPTADEILVDSASFDHPSGNLTRIANNAGATITVLSGWCVLYDRSANTNSARKAPMSQLRRSGTQLDYAISSEYSRGAQSGDDTFTAGYSYCAPVELTSAQYIELDYFDLAQAAASDLMVNASDNAALYFWAIRFDNLGAVDQDMTATIAQSLSVTQADLDAIAELSMTEEMTLSVTEADLNGSGEIAATEAMSLVITEADLNDGNFIEDIAATIAQSLSITEADLRAIAELSMTEAMSIAITEADLVAPVIEDLAATIPLTLVVETTPSIIESVEFVTVTITATSEPVTVNLTKGQNRLQCVPFFTMRNTTTITDAHQDRMGEVEFVNNAGTPAVRVTATDRSDDDDTIFQIFVVEFNSSSIKVQQITGVDLASSVDSINQTITDVSSQNNAFFIYSAQFDGAARDQHNNALIQVRFNGASTTSVTLSRRDAPTLAQVLGTLYVIEAVSGEFVVDHREIDITVTDDIVGTDTISSVVEVDTFLIHTWETSEISDDMRDGAWVADLQDATTVRIRPA